LGLEYSSEYLIEYSILDNYRSGITAGDLSASVIVTPSKGLKCSKLIPSIPVINV